MGGSRSSTVCIVPHASPPAHLLPALPQAAAQAVAQAAGANSQATANAAAQVCGVGLCLSDSRLPPRSFSPGPM